MSPKDTSDNYMSAPVIGNEVGSEPVHDVRHAVIEDPNWFLRAAGAIVLSGAVTAAMLTEIIIRPNRHR